jgi:hypothetical protein
VQVQVLELEHLLSSLLGKVQVQVQVLELEHLLSLLLA